MALITRACFLAQDDSSGLEVIDKVAFACLYLPDAWLAEYIDRLTAEVISRGNLDGLLLTGQSAVLGILSWARWCLSFAVRGRRADPNQKP